jgi:hypothetical protein
MQNFERNRFKIFNVYEHSRARNVINENKTIYKSNGCIWQSNMIVNYKFNTIFQTSGNNKQHIFRYKRKTFSYIM